MSSLNLIMVVLEIVAVVAATTFAVIYRPAMSTKLFVSGIGLSFLTLCFTGNSLVLVPIVLLIVSLACSMRSLSPKAERIWVGATSIVLALGFISRWTTIIGQLNHVLQQHPVISLADRLDYESDVRTSIEFNTDAVWLRPVNWIAWDERTDFENLLNEQGDNVTLRRKLGFRSLLSAHRNIETQFQLAVGFGVMRTTQIPFQHWEIEVPDRPLLPLSGEGCERATANDFEDTSKPKMNLQPWHRRNLVDFAHPLTLGHLELDRNTSG